MSHKGYQISDHTTRYKSRERPSALDYCKVCKGEGREYTDHSLLDCIYITTDEKDELWAKCLDAWENDVCSDSDEDDSNDMYSLHEDDQILCETDIENSNETNIGYTACHYEEIMMENGCSSKHESMPGKVFTQEHVFSLQSASSVCRLCQGEGRYGSYSHSMIQCGFMSTKDKQELLESCSKEFVGKVCFTDSYPENVIHNIPPEECCEICRLCIAEGRDDEHSTATCPYISATEKQAIITMFRTELGYASDVIESNETREKKKCSTCCQRFCSCTYHDGAKLSVHGLQKSVWDEHVDSSEDNVTETLSSDTLDKMRANDTFTHTDGQLEAIIDENCNEDMIHMQDDGVIRFYKTRHPFCNDKNNEHYGKPVPYLIEPESPSQLPTPPGIVIGMEQSHSNLSESIFLIQQMSNESQIPVNFEGERMLYDVHHRDPHLRFEKELCPYLNIDHTVIVNSTGEPGGEKRGHSEDCPYTSDHKRDYRWKCQPDSTAGVTMTTGGTDSTAGITIKTSGTDSTAGVTMTTGSTDRTAGVTMTTSGADSAAGITMTTDGTDSAAGVTMTTGGTDSTVAITMTTGGTDSAAGVTMTTGGTADITMTTGGTDSAAGVTMTTGGTDSTGITMTTGGADSTVGVTMTTGGADITTGVPMTTGGTLGIASATMMTGGTDRMDGVTKTICGTYGAFGVTMTTMDIVCAASTMITIGLDSAASIAVLTSSSSSTAGEIITAVSPDKMSEDSLSSDNMDFIDSVHQLPSSSTCSTDAIQTTSTNKRIPHIGKEDCSRAIPTSCNIDCTLDNVKSSDLLNVQFRRFTCHHAVTVAIIFMLHVTYCAESWYKHIAPTDRPPPFMCTMHLAQVMIVTMNCLIDFVCKTLSKC